MPAVEPGHHSKRGGASDQVEQPTEQASTLKLPRKFSEKGVRPGVMTENAISARYLNQPSVLFHNIAGVKQV